MLTVTVRDMGLMVLMPNLYKHHSRSSHSSTFFHTYEPRSFLRYISSSALHDLSKCLFLFHCNAPSLGHVILFSSLVTFGGKFGGIALSNFVLL